MGASIEFFAGPRDDQALRDYASTLGLQVIPMLWDRRNDDIGDPGRYPACFFSFMPLSGLHPHPTRGIITDATDPLIEFTRAFYTRPSLIAGRVYWSDDVEDFARQTRPYFRSLGGWIRRNWKKRDDGYHIGPEAAVLVSDGATIAYVPPGTSVRQVRVP